MNLREEAVFGTDFTFEDIVPDEIEDADYQRLPDEQRDGSTVYVVEVTPKPDANSEYSKFVVYVDKSRCVPLRTRYWDEKGVEVKELHRRARPDPGRSRACTGRCSSPCGTCSSSPSRRCSSRS